MLLPFGVHFKVYEIYYFVSYLAHNVHVLMASIDHDYKLSLVDLGARILKQKFLFVTIRLLLIVRQNLDDIRTQSYDREKC